MKGFKAFKKGLVCRGKQYAENTVFEEENAVICNSGMHFCKNPLDCLDYYPLIDANGEFSDFAEVEALDKVFTDDNEKYCTKKLKIGAKLDLAGFIKASVDVTRELIKEEARSRTKDAADLVKAGGYYSTLAGGYYSKLAGGDYSKLAGGDNSTLAGGRHSAMMGDHGSVARGEKGALIVLIEREWKNGEYIIKSFAAEIVDGECVKENVPYKLVNGELVELESEGANNG